MPLSNCPDCGRDVSTRARQCVHCGRPWPASRCGAATCIALVMGIVLALGAVGLIASKQRCVRERMEKCRVEMQKCRAEMEKRIQTEQKAQPTVAPAAEAKPAEPAVKEEKKEE